MAASTQEAALHGCLHVGELPLGRSLQSLKGSHTQVCDCIVDFIIIEIIIINILGKLFNIERIFETCC